jgi:hypothetical protein
MKALKNILTAKHAFVAEGAAWALPGEAGAVTTAREAAGAKKETPAGTHLKNVALFLAAPFIGLAYLMTFPLVGLCMFAWLAGKKLLANKTARPIVLAAAAPFATIAFVTVGPVVGLGALAWIGGRALLRS